MFRYVAVRLISASLFNAADRWARANRHFGERKKRCSSSANTSRQHSCPIDLLRGSRSGAQRRRQEPKCTLQKMNCEWSSENGVNFFARWKLLPFSWRESNAICCCCFVRPAIPAFIHTWHASTCLIAYPPPFPTLTSLPLPFRTAYSILRIELSKSNLEKW